MKSGADARPSPADACAPAARLSRPARLYLACVLCAGAATVWHSLVELNGAPFSSYWFLLAALTILSGRFPIQVPGLPATFLSVSEAFVFISVFLFGPAVATLTLVLDGLIVSLSQRDRRLYRTLFNMAEPAVSIWVAGQAFFALAGVPPLSHQPVDTARLLLPVFVMAGLYFVSNTLLTAIAVSFETRTSALELWRKYFIPVSLSSLGGASLAALVVQNASGINIYALGLVLPLLVVFYVTFKASTGRLEDAHRHVLEVNELYRATVETLAIAVDAKDQVTHGHIRRVQHHSVRLARVLGVTGELELKALDAASLLHDVGKLAVPDYILNKPGALNHAEYEQMKLHANAGANILAAVHFPYPVVPIVRHHHENWDGTGYPHGLAGDAIPFGARILSVVDCFDALTSDRPYRRQLSDQEALAIVRSRQGTMYDPRVVDAFIEILPSLRAAENRQPELAPAGEGRVAADRIARPTAEAFLATAAVRRAIAALEPAMIEHLRGVSSPSFAVLYAYDPGSGLLSPARVLPRGHAALERLRIPLGERLTGWVAATRQTIVNSDAALDLGDAAELLGARTCFSTPLVADDTLLGVLSLYSQAEEGFTKADAERLERLAREVALFVTGVAELESSVRQG